MGLNLAGVGGSAMLVLMVSPHLHLPARERERRVPAEATNADATNRASHQLKDARLDLDLDTLQKNENPVDIYTDKMGAVTSTRLMGCERLVPHARVADPSTRAPPPSG